MVFFAGGLWKSAELKASDARTRDGSAWLEHSGRAFFC